MTARSEWLWRYLTLFALLAPSAALSAAGLKSSFASENQIAMNRMMIGMAAAPTGNVDLDFSTMMIAHHQGAIDMAQAELRHGRNEQLRRIAQGIVVEQLQEIEAMRLAARSEAHRLPAGRAR